MYEHYFASYKIIDFNEDKIIAAIYHGAKTCFNFLI